MPNLNDDLSIKLQEGDSKVTVNLLLEPVAFPQPSKFEWLKGDQPLRRSGIATSYSSITFSSVMRSDTGYFTVSATNYLLNNSTQPVGTDMGSFILCVLCKLISGEYRSAILCSYSFIPVLIIH